MKIRITRVDKESLDIPLPTYATIGSAGMDLFAAVIDEIILPPDGTHLVPTGYRIELPMGYEAQIRPRSGLALKNNIGVLNSPGTIDSDYRGEIKVILKNFGDKEFRIKRGDRIAQMIIAPYIRISWDEVESIDDTTRGAGGFGHSGQ
jgi:dUTP pyrophosphatase